MNDTELVQRSEQWKLARTGSLGASEIADAIATLKRSGDPTKTALDLMYEIAAERLTGQPARRGGAMQWGVEHEAEARQHYAFLTNAPVVEVGLIRHPTIKGSHSSPDALVGGDGGLEVKCPTSAVHLQTLLAGVVPDEHRPQCLWAMACTGRAWWDFVSYDPRFPPELQLFTCRIERDEAAIMALEERVRKFLAEVNARLAEIGRRYELVDGDFDHDE